uniref:sucrose synthase n=2 Tax=Quercus lobata TaxID=97700 RepID=A0A7N2MPV2_QUELO
MDRSQSLNAPPYFDGSNYAFGKYECVLFYVRLMRRCGIPSKMVGKDPLQPNPNGIRLLLLWQMPIAKRLTLFSVVFEHKLQEIGLERGCGNNAEQVSEMIHHLLDLLEAPEPRTPDTFLGRIPMVFNVVIMSPHGYFAQDNVLGYPDTGDQVVYILDQVRALESEMLLRIKHQGLYIIPRILIVTRLLRDAVGNTCGERLERVYGTEHSFIL